MSRARSQSRGLTLLEVLVSIAILALVSSLVYGALDGMQRSRQGIERVGDRYHQGRQALSRMARELQSAFVSLHQPLQIANSNRTTVFIGTDSGSSDRLDFTSFSHKRLMRNVHESDQNELSYFMGKDPDRGDKYDLLRREQREIDTDPTHGGVVNVLCEDVTSIDFSYLDQTSGMWVESWDSTQAGSAAQYNHVPLQVKIKLVLRGGEADKPIKLMTKVTTGMQIPLNFAIPRQQSTTTGGGK
jgi:general secretion pathway protein J